MDGQEGENIKISTGLPQGSPVSLLLFVTYMSDVHREVEKTCDVTAFPS